MAKGKYRTEYDHFIKLLREIRLEVGLPQTELAKKLGKPQQFVSKYESGERRLDLVELRQICKILEMPILEFVRRFESRVS